MATIELWPQWLTFLSIPHGDLLPCKFEWGVQNFLFPTFFDSYRELLLNTKLNVRTLLAYFFKMINLNSSITLSSLDMAI